MAKPFKRKNSPYYYIDWTDHNGQRHIESTKSTDRKIAERMAAKKLNDSALRRDGIVDDASDRFSKEARRPIAVHVDEFRASLETKNRDDEYLEQTINRLNAVLAICGIERAIDLKPTAVEFALRQLKDRGCGVATCNSYLRSVKGFARWLYRSGGLRENPLEILSCSNEEVDRRHTRRELTSDEFLALIAATEKRTHLAHALIGPDRAMLYRLAAHTGFRASELRSLSAGSFDLDAGPATVTVKAAYSKRRSTDVQPLRRDLVAMLRPWLANRPAGQLVFGKMPEDTARMLKADLAAARKAWIASGENLAEREKSDYLVYRDEAGDVFDFHAFRHVYTSRIVSSGASIKEAQTLSRHSTAELTVKRYSHVKMHDLEKPLESLPPLGGKCGGAISTELDAPQRTDCGSSDAPVLRFKTPNEQNGATRCNPVQSESKKNGRRKSSHSDGLNENTRQTTMKASTISEGKRMVSGHTGKMTAPSGYAEENSDFQMSAAPVLRFPADLARIISLWPTLPESIKAAVLAVVSTALPVEAVKPKSKAKRSSKRGR